MKNIKLTEGQLERAIRRLSEQEDPDWSDDTALLVYHAQQIAKLAEKQPDGRLGEIVKNPEFQNSVKLIKKLITRV